MKCWLEETNEDVCEFNNAEEANENCENCWFFLDECAVVVYCNCLDCMHNRRIPFKKIVKYNKNYTPLGEKDYYKGVCGRHEIGIKEKVIATRDIEHKIPSCWCKSDIFIKGHMDFSKFPQGGTVEPDNKSAADSYGFGS